MRKSLILLLGILLLIFPLLFLGCEGDDGKDGAAGVPGQQGNPGDPGRDATQIGKAESCSVCHTDEGNAERNGAGHQAYYNELYQDNVIRVSGVAFSQTGEFEITTTFTMTTGPDDDPYDCEQANSVGGYFIAYDNNTRRFELPAIDTPELERGGVRFSLFPSVPSPTSEDQEAPYQGTYVKTHLGAGVCQVVATYDVAYLPGGVLPAFLADPGLAIIYGYEGSVAYRISRSAGDRVRQVNFPFAGLSVVNDDGSVDYVSAANNDGCSKCHTDPYLKHGYIYAQVDRDPTTDFWTCKGCHLDNGKGGHLEWQLIVDDPVFWASGDEPDAGRVAKYAYKTRLMNDVHMSHAMEFPYPQSMANCVTCHENKLETILTDENFVVETCKSCHPQEGSDDYTGGMAGGLAWLPLEDSEKRPTSELALRNKMPGTLHTGLALDGSVVCNLCHAEGAGFGAPVFSDIHTGYDKLVYTAGGVKYADAIKAVIDGADYANGVLTIDFHVEGSAGSYTAADVEPSNVYVAVYGYGTKEFMGYSAISAQQDPTSAAPNWVYTADIAGSNYADNVANGMTKVEIAVRPRLRINPPTDNTALALNAVTATFDLAANDFVASPAQLVDVKKCEECHAALALSYHTADRGGSITMCRICHPPRQRGSHWEMASRSLVNYVHAIHSFQAQDAWLTPADDPVRVLHLEDHQELFPYPKHGIEDCESCHFPLPQGGYNVADQANSLPGVLASSRTFDTDGNDSWTASGWTRKIGAVPGYVVGANSKACGGCHRADLIIEDDASGLAAFNAHTGGFGNLIDVGDITSISTTAYFTAWWKACDEVMAQFWSP